MVEEEHHNIKKVVRDMMERKVDNLEKECSRIEKKGYMFFH
tara:strand:- start:1563 stop:1685 length:123 start_codon:yes stop_codon:yes gene_type:complete